MNLRLSQKLNTKIKAGKFIEMPLDENPHDMVEQPEGNRFGRTQSSPLFRQG